MTKKIYIKDDSFDPIYKEVSRGFYTKTRIMPTLLVFAGLFTFATQVLLPVLVFKTHDESIALVDNATVLGRAAGFQKFEFEELETKQDEYQYNPRSDFQVRGAQATNVPDYFLITIPKLGIKEALVETNAKDLNPDTALGHYAGTVLPGEVGNSFIFGHSVLPWFFNPKNYKTIFSTLGKLSSGDEFQVTYNNTIYNYVVESVEELSPKEVRPLAELKPKYLNKSTMVLMTCSPPGTKLKRLLVNAVMVS